MSEPAPGAEVPAWLTALLATSCALIVANIYYPQTLVGPIAAALGLASSTAGLIVTMTQIGYCLGLVFLVPLADLVENRRLVVAIIAVGALALIGAATLTHPPTFFAAMLLVGIGSVSVQVLVPYAAHLAPEESRGRVVGNVMGGVMFGIMAARPAASFIAGVLPWQAVFVIAAAVMVATMAMLWFALPPRRPEQGLTYGGLIASMAGLARRTPILQRRSFYHACLFGTFSLFWTISPLLLARTYHLTQIGIALFALAGVAGAVSAPIAGRLADRGHTRRGTGLAMLAVVIALLLCQLGGAGTPVSLAILVAAAIILDFGVTANLVLGQRALFVLGPHIRGRLNALYLATFFVGGAIGSALGGWAYAQGGWSLAIGIALALPTMALIAYATE